MARQVDVEAGAAAGLAVALDPAVVLLDDAEDHRQPQAGALARRLGGEERVEDARQVLRGDADAGVGHAQADEVPGPRFDPALRVVVGDRPFAGLQMKSLPPSGMASQAFRQRLTSTWFIWPESAWTRPRPAGARTSRRDARVDGPPEQGDDLRDRFVEVDRAQPEERLPGEAEQLPGQLRGPPGGLLDGRRQLERLGAGTADPA